MGAGRRRTAMRGSGRPLALGPLRSEVVGKLTSLSIFAIGKLWKKRLGRRVTTEPLIAAAAGAARWDLCGRYRQTLLAHERAPSRPRALHAEPPASHDPAPILRSRPTRPNHATG